MAKNKLKVELEQEVRDADDRIKSLKIQLSKRSDKYNEVINRRNELLDALKNLTSEHDKNVEAYRELQRSSTVLKKINDVQADKLQRYSTTVTSISFKLKNVTIWNRKKTLLAINNLLLTFNQKLDKL